MEKEKKVLYSGMQATGTLTLGNYLGALKNWVSLCDDYECFYGVMDLHSLTVRIRQNFVRMPENYMPSMWQPVLIRRRTASIISPMCRHMHSWHGFWTALPIWVS